MMCIETVKGNSTYVAGGSAKRDQLKTEKDKAVE